MSDLSHTWKFEEPELTAVTLMVPADWVEGLTELVKELKRFRRQDPWVFLATPDSAADLVNLLDSDDNLSQNLQWMRSQLCRVADYHATP